MAKRRTERKHNVWRRSVGPLAQVMREASRFSPKKPVPGGTWTYVLRGARVSRPKITEPEDVTALSSRETC